MTDDEHSNGWKPCIIVQPKNGMITVFTSMETFRNSDLYSQGGTIDATAELNMNFGNPLVRVKDGVLQVVIKDGRMTFKSVGTN